MRHIDWLPPFLAIAGAPDIEEQLLDGVIIFEVGGGRDCRMHLSRYNTRRYLLGEAEETLCREIFYYSGDGDSTALRYNDRTAIFLEHRFLQTRHAWAKPRTELRIPLFFNRRRDPYERANITSNIYCDWYLDRTYVLLPASE